VEIHRLVPSTLSAVVKVLTGVFGHPERFLDLVVELGDVGLEVLGLSSRASEWGKDPDQFSFLGTVMTSPSQPLTLV
jgi:hypothetical protein